jgi:hypothetical protein
MTFRATILSAEEAFSRLKAQAASTRQYLLGRVNDLQQPTSDSGLALSVIQHFGTVAVLMNSWAATPGLAAYAQAQVNDPTYDIVAEFNTMMTAIISARDSLIAMFPKDAQGFMAYQTLNPDASITNRTFTAAQLAPVVTTLNNVLATIS